MGEAKRAHRNLKRSPDPPWLALPVPGAVHLYAYRTSIVIVVKGLRGVRGDSCGIDYRIVQYADLAFVMHAHVVM